MHLIIDKNLIQLSFVLLLKMRKVVISLSTSKKKKNRYMSKDYAKHDKCD